MEFLFLLFIFLSHIYYGYRYAFRYNSDSTSPTYQDTPFIFQMAKYLIALMIVYFSTLLFFVRKKKLFFTETSKIFLKIIIFFVCYVFIITLNLLLNGQYGEDLLIVKMMFFFPILLLIPIFYSYEISLNKFLFVLVSIGLIYHVSYSIIQILSYFIFDRLPALAYANSLVRFGGGWDDPNGFGIFLVIPLILSLSSKLLFKQRIYRLLIFLISFCLLILTYSISAIIGFVVALSLFCLLKRKIIKFLVFLVLIFVPVLSSASLQDKIILLYELKAGSIQQHISTLSIERFINESNLLNLLFGLHNSAIFNENFYIYFGEVYGVIGLFIFVTIIFLTVILGIKRSIIALNHDPFRQDLHCFMTSFIVAMSIASMGIPYFIVFPVNFYFWIFVLLIWLTPGCRREKCSTSMMPLMISKQTA